MNFKNNLNNFSTEEMKFLHDSLSNLLEKRSSSSLHLDGFSQEYTRYSKSYHSLKYNKSIELSFQKMIEFFGKDAKLIDINFKRIIDFIDWLKQTAPKGYRVYYRNLKAAFNKAKDWEYINDNPFTKVKLSKQQLEFPFYLTVEDLNLILEETVDVTHSTLFLFAFFTGCRLSEIINLKWSNVDFSNRVITIGDNEFITKTREQRIIPLSNRLHSALLELRNNNSSNGYVFCKKNGYRYSTDYISKLFKSIVRKLGFDEKIHFHTLRHSFASHLVQNGADLYTVKEILGHSNVKTTERYAHLNLNNLKKAMEVFNYAA
ncbi:MAG: tyrosine-type recombinase/integrase [Melioribacteraceae bacterium]|nr:MAG: tyrosine-type recombinase/integrase [Melioribacteraceae bacterium]